MLTAISWTDPHCASSVSSGEWRSRKVSLHSKLEKVPVALHLFDNNKLSTFLKHGEELGLPELEPHSRSA